MNEVERTGESMMNEKKKCKRGLKGCLLAVIILLIMLAIAGGVGWSFIAREHREAASLPLDRVDFGSLKDGEYSGLYEGGMYRWRRNACQVSVVQGRVVDIQLAESEDTGGENADPEILYQRVLAEQSLQVDTISGATLTSKAYLQCVENALLEIQMDTE